jgi:aromatic ring-cleaving dioxygenase
LNYDIHIYWRNNDERDEALALQRVLIANSVQTFPFVEKPIGPHPYPMFESHVTTQTLTAIESLLVINRKSCSMLIHEKTGDHVYDHTKGARFLGEPLQLNIEFLKTF